MTATTALKREKRRTPKICPVSRGRLDLRLHAKLIHCKLLQNAERPASCRCDIPSN